MKQREDMIRETLDNPPPPLQKNNHKKIMTARRESSSVKRRRQKIICLATWAITMRAQYTFGTVAPPSDRCLLLGATAARPGLGHGIYPFYTHPPCPHVKWLVSWQVVWGGEGGSRCQPRGAIELSVRRRNYVESE